MKTKLDPEQPSHSGCDPMPPAEPWSRRRRRLRWGLCRHTFALNRFDDVPSWFSNSSRKPVLRPSRDSRTVRLEKACPTDLVDRINRVRRIDRSDRIRFFSQVSRSDGINLIRLMYCRRPIVMNRSGGVGDDTIHVDIWTDGRTGETDFGRTPLLFSPGSTSEQEHRQATTLVLRSSGR